MTSNSFVEPLMSRTKLTNMAPATDPELTLLFMAQENIRVREIVAKCVRDVCGLMEGLLAVASTKSTNVSWRNFFVRKNACAFVGSSSFTVLVWRACSTEWVTLTGQRCALAMFLKHDFEEMVGVIVMHLVTADLYGHDIPIVR